jgi:hypothetical protein
LRCIIECRGGTEKKQKKKKEKEEAAREEDDVYRRFGNDGRLGEDGK